jgi:hypothetical protein
VRRATDAFLDVLDDDTLADLIKPRKGAVVAAARGEWRTESGE